MERYISCPAEGKSARSVRNVGTLQLNLHLETTLQWEINVLEYREETGRMKQLTVLMMRIQTLG